jgi:hypothetical protein
MQCVSAEKCLTRQETLPHVARAARMNQWFIFPGINERAVLDDARRDANKGKRTKVHYHKSGLPCNDKCHEVKASG